MMKTVTYTDPAWAVTPERTLDPARATVEMAIYGDAVRIRFGAIENGAFATHGPKICDVVRGADAVVIYRAAVTPELVNAMKPSVRVVARQGVGVDNLNAPLLEQNGIYAFHVPDYCIDEVAAHTLGLLLALQRNICLHNERVKRGRWDIFQGGVPRRLMHMTVGIVGLGRIGLATSHRLQGLVHQVLAYDPYVQEDFMTAHRVVKVGSLEALMAGADIVVLHCGLTEETRHIIRAESLAHAKPGTLLINTARGQLVASEAVHDALRSGRLGGYATDVFSPENPHDDPLNRALIQLENVIVTCHRAFLSVESEESLRRRVATEIRYVLTTGCPPRSGNLTPSLSLSPS